MQTGMCHGMGEAPDPPSKHIGWEHEEPAEVGRIQLPPFIHCRRVKGSSPKILPRGEIMSSSQGQSLSLQDLPVELHLLHSPTDSICPQQKPHIAGANTVEATTAGLAGVGQSSEEGG